MPFLNFNLSLDVNKQAELTRCACAISHQPRSPSATPSARYATAALEALSIIDLNSAPVQALPVLPLETVPLDAAAIKAAIMPSASLASEMSRKSVSPVVT